MTGGSNTLHFFYDAQNKPAVVLFNGTAYAYLYNLQGDVIALVDANGSKVVEYKYDAWGNPLSKTGTLATTLGTLQLFRYRGYVFDEEIGAASSILILLKFCLYHTITLDSTLCILTAKTSLLAMLIPPEDCRGLPKWRLVLAPSSLVQQ